VLVVLAALFKSEFLLGRWACRQVGCRDFLHFAAAQLVVKACLWRIQLMPQANLTYGIIFADTNTNESAFSRLRSAKSTTFAQSLREASSGVGKWCNETMTAKAMLSSLRQQAKRNKAQL